MSRASKILELVGRRFKYRVWFPQNPTKKSERYTKETTADSGIDALTNLVFSLPEIYYRGKVARTKIEKRALVKDLKALDDWDYCLV